ncbi:MAG: 4'-phosphopantetheinyl transferase superfamily protein [Candidatus Aminicenantes bacterium]|nr:4'-phosphopantetheinyl transferase superfamily protein [Candidatus Aminicenantes bacterium]
MTEVYALKLSEIEEETYEKLLLLVDRQKQDKVKKFYRREDSLRTLLADLLVRNLVIEKTNLRNEEISFSYNEYGKPTLNDVENFHFNVSHSGEWIVCAVDSEPVGVDVEEIAPVDLDISRNYFSPDEHSDLLSQEDRIAYFFTLWTLKESYIKIVGKGLSLPLNSFSIRFSDEEIGIAASGRKLDDTFFTQYDIDDKYKMAVCAQDKEFPSYVTHKSVDELVHTFVESGGYLYN